jgi:hypothetical protein
MIAEPIAPEIAFLKLMFLNHGPHCSIEDQDLLPDDIFK